SGTDVTGLLPIANGGTNSSTLGTTLVGFVTNDTNVTGSIANNTLTLGWTGVLAVNRGGIGTTTLGDLTVGSGLSIVGGQKVLIGTSTQISLSAGVISNVSTGTAGNNFNITTSTNSLVINLPNASVVNNGQLLATDFLTFNNKLSGSAAVNQVTYFTAASTTAGSANFLWDNTAKSLLINTSTPAGASLYVVASTSSQTLPILQV